MKTIGIIPARAGSKSIQEKNTAILGGQALILWCIDAAILAQNLDSIICSTNNEVVKEICRIKGVPILDRPDELATDDTPIIDVVFHVLNLVGDSYDIVALIQPTSPFLRTEIIDLSLRTLKLNPDFNSVQTVTGFSHNYHAFNQRKFDGAKIEFVFKKDRELAYNKQRKPIYYIFGNFIATRISALENGLFADPSYGIIIPREEAVDIDSEEDLKYAEFLIAQT